MLDWVPRRCGNGVDTGSCEVEYTQWNSEKRNASKVVIGRTKSSGVHDVRVSLAVKDLKCIYVK